MIPSCYQKHCKCKMASPHPPSPSKARATWPPLTEHILKTILYCLFVIHAALSAHRSSTTFSYAINALFGLVALWMVKGEIELAIKRLQRKLPPGYLGFPIVREIQFLLAVGSGGIQQKLAEHLKSTVQYSHKVSLDVSTLPLVGKTTCRGYSTMIERH